MAGDLVAEFVVKAFDESIELGVARRIFSARASLQEQRVWPLSNGESTDIFGKCSRAPIGHFNDYSS